MQGGKYLRSQRQLEEDLSTDQPALTEEEEACEKHFTPQVTVLSSGCVQVCLPFKHHPETHGTSMETARYRTRKASERKPLLKGSS